MKQQRQTDWEQAWSPQVLSAGVDRWAPWLAFAAAVGVALVGSL